MLLSLSCCKLVCHYSLHLRITLCTHTCHISCILLLCSAAQKMKSSLMKTSSRRAGPRSSSRHAVSKILELEKHLFQWSKQGSMIQLLDDRISSVCLTVSYVRRVVSSRFLGSRLCMFSRW
jgi:hypothetical protein